MSEPTLGEVMRRLDEAVKQNAETARKVEHSQALADQKYVTYLLHQEQIQAIRKDIVDLEKAREADGTFRRQVLLGLAVAIAGTLGSLVVAVLPLIAGR